MPLTLSLPRSDEDITHTAQEMIEIYGRGAMAKSEEIVDELISVGSYSLAQTWERNQDMICGPQAKLWLRLFAHTTRCTLLIGSPNPHVYLAIR